MNIYLILGNLQIFIQIILWFFSFYLLDFELFNFILNESITLKVILGIIIISNQLFLYQYLFNLIKIDSIFEKENNSELQNINEKHDYTTCKKCNILRPKRTHHCRYCDKCILKMDHHCFILNKCIGKNNYFYFLRYLVFAELNTSFIFCITSYVCIYYYTEFTYFLLIKYIILIIFSFMSSCGLFFYILFHLYLYFANLTTLELFYPTLRINTSNKIGN